MDFPFLHTDCIEYIQSFINCFNPCSYGFSVLTNCSDIDDFKRFTVSILVLMDFPFLHMKKFNITKDFQRFQSLFLWIFRSYDPFIFQYNCIYFVCFNPCSYGFSVLTLFQD